MTTLLFLIASIAVLGSIFVMKTASETNKAADYRLVQANILALLSAIHLERAKTTIDGVDNPNIPSIEECELLLERSKISISQAQAVLAVLQDVAKENNIYF